MAEIENKIRNLEDENYRLKEELDYEMFSAREAFRIVVESNLDAIIGIDNKCNIILFNPAAEDLFQYVEKEVLLKPIEILFKEDIEEIYHNKLVKFLNEGIFERDLLNKTTEVLLKRRDGSYFEGETSFAVGRGKTNLYIVLTIRDISYRKKMERELIESEAKARTLLNTPHQSILLIDNKGNILDCNKSCRQIFAENHTEIVGKHISNCKNTKMINDLISKIEWVFSSSEILRYESNIDGEYYDNVIYPVVDKDGSVFQTVLVSNNITDFVQEQKINTSVDSIPINQKLFSDLKHEFRTPISGSIGMINILDKTNLNSEQKEFVSIIKDSSEYLNNIFNNFFDFLSSLKQNIQLSVKPFNIKNTIENIVATHISFKKTNDIDLKIDFQQALPENIYADENRYKQILGILYSYAVNQIDKGSSILIKLSAPQNDGTSTFIKTEICCSNFLISEEEATTISNIFTAIQLNPNSLCSFKETEYYLATMLTDLLGGKIQLLNLENKNFTFCFTIKAKIS